MLSTSAAPSSRRCVVFSSFSRLSALVRRESTGFLYPTFPSFDLRVLNLGPLGRTLPKGKILHTVDFLSCAGNLAIIWITSFLIRRTSVRKPLTTSNSFKTSLHCCSILNMIVFIFFFGAFYLLTSSLPLYQIFAQVLTFLRRNYLLLLGGLNRWSSPGVLTSRSLGSVLLHSHLHLFPLPARMVMGFITQLL